MILPTTKFCSLKPQRLSVEHWRGSKGTRHCLRKHSRREPGALLKPLRQGSWPLPEGLPLFGMFLIRNVLS